MSPAEQGQVPESPLGQAIKDQGLREEVSDDKEQVFPHSCHDLICPFLAFRGEA